MNELVVYDEDNKCFRVVRIFVNKYYGPIMFNCIQIQDVLL